MSRLPLGNRRYAELSSANSYTSANTAPSSTYNTPDVSSNSQYNGQAFDYHAETKAPVSHMNPFSNTPNPSNGATGFANSNPVSSYPTPNSADSTQRRKSSKSKQIDTDKIPRPIVDTESSYNPPTYATSTNNLPPPSYTNYITVDDGNAGPRYVRSTFYKVPMEESMINNTHIPLSLILQPLADPSPEEEGVPLIDYGEAGPLRCNRCRAYINPNWTYTHNGKTGICNLCKMGNEIPPEYYSSLDMNGNRADKFEKFELCKGVYEFVAPTTYHTRPLVTPNILFCIEASSASYLSGVFHQVFSSLQALLDYIPSPELVKIGIATYDTGINFFKVPDDLTKEMSVIHLSDVNTSCLPLPKKYLFLSLQDERDKINYLIERIIKYYESGNKLQKVVHANCFGAAIVDCCDLLIKEGGRVLAFTTQATTVGIGKIFHRDDPKSYGTEKEKVLFAPHGEEYTLWAKRSLEKRVAVDLFCFSPDYIDLTTVGQLSSVTGGNIYYYPGYNPSYDGERLHYDIARNLTRYVGYDAIMTIRTCQGINLQEYITPSGKKSDPELEFSTIDADTSINAYFKHEEKLTEDNITFQAAMLYTNPYGQRVIRVLNFKISTSNDLVTIFRSCDAEAVAQATLKKSIVNLPTAWVAHIRKSFLDSLIAILYNYRHHCANTSSQSQLILPESLKVLPAYYLAALKTNILKTGTTIKPDDRAYDLVRFMRMPLNVLSNLLYPKMYPLHTIWTESEYAPGNVVGERIVVDNSLPASVDKIDDNGIYLIDNAETLFMYVKRNVDPIFIQHLFGVESYEEVASLTSFPDGIESEYFTKVSNIIDQLRKNKNSSYQPVRIVTEKDAMESTLFNLLVEDERQGESYSNFLCNIHKAIQEKFA